MKSSHTNKWHIENKKGYLKIRIVVAVNVKAKKILSIKLMDKQVQYNEAVPELVENIIKSNKKITIGKLFADGAFDNNKIFRYLVENGILPCIKVRKNAQVRLKKDIF